MCLKFAGWVANSVDPDQTPHCGVWSGSTPFSQVCLSKYLRKYDTWIFAVPTFFNARHHTGLCIKTAINKTELHYYYYLLQLYAFYAQHGIKALTSYANREGSDGRAHPCSLIWTYTAVSIDSVSGQRRLRSACADAQADLSLRFLQIAYRSLFVFVPTDRGMAWEATKWTWRYTKGSKFQTGSAHLHRLSRDIAARDRLTRWSWPYSVLAQSDLDLQ